MEWEGSGNRGNHGNRTLKMGEQNERGEPVGTGTGYHED